MQCLASLTRRALLVLATTLLLACSVPAGAGPLVDAVDSITIAVSALERSLPLYEDVLSSEWVSDVEAITNATFAATGKRAQAAGGHHSAEAGALIGGDMRGDLKTKLSSFTGGL